MTITDYLLSSHDQTYGPAINSVNPLQGHPLRGPHTPIHIHSPVCFDFFTLPTEAPALVYPVSPDTSAFFHRASFAPDPLLHKHFGEGSYR